VIAQCFVLHGPVLGIVALDVHILPIRKKQGSASDYGKQDGEIEPERSPRRRTSADGTHESRAKPDPQQPERGFRKQPERQKAENNPKKQGPPITKPRSILGRRHH
jgi:hypothetical protein